MSRPLSSVQQDVIDHLIEMVKNKLPQSKHKQLQSFITQYYSGVADDDLTERKIEDLYGAVISHWRFMEKRQPDEAKVEVFNPQFQQHGWQSKHTVIQIVQTDMPFLVDSIRMELNRHGITIHLIIHPGAVKVKRNDKDELTQILPGQSSKDLDGVEAPIYIEVDQQCDAKELKYLKEQLHVVLDHVKVAVDDWQSMRGQALAVISELEKSSLALETQTLKESIDFIRWIANDRFTFLGYREYKLEGKGDAQVLRVVAGSGLGMLRDDESHHPVRKLSEMTEEARKVALSKQLLVIAKLNMRARVHRPAYIDYIGIKQFDDKGNVTGEKRFIGLYTSVAYHSLPTTIPLLKQKMFRVLERSGFSPQGHSGKELLNVLENFPRDELFQSPEDDLYNTVMGILHIQERRNIWLFIREDTYGRFFSCLVFVPRDKFNSQLREQLGLILLKELNGQELAFSHRFSESVLMRIHFIVRLAPDAVVPKIDQAEILHKLREAARSWGDNLHDALVEHFGEDHAMMLFHKYAGGFQVGYQDSFDPRTAVYDIEYMEKLQSSDCLEMCFYRPLDETGNRLYFKLYSSEETIALSDVLPMLENMGFRVISERMHRIRTKDGAVRFINDFGMSLQSEEDINVEEVRDIFEQAFAAVWYQYAENDGFNMLVMNAKLPWDKVAVLRAYAKYFRQIGFTYSQAYVEQTLNKYPKITALLVKLFEKRFDPKKTANIKQLTELKQKILTQLEHVSGLDEDRILTKYVDVICATQRTNFFQKNDKDESREYFSFKFDPTAIPDIPLPVPLHEIFVYSPRVEGVHLRGGDVARGGLRWSDRREDFRTEVLGLMKAQQVKNSVIVPAGAKGGFVPQRLPTHGGRDDIMQEVVQCYQTFITGLLDITDNLKGAEVIPPNDCVRYDGDDPYLVVAADKGTATFSDTANQISKSFDFWLGDAFASGGSIGYDHKKMGITARGAWESVKRHFRELGTDIQNEPFTVIGIGDMAGDVFGNGMLLSRFIKLVGAFNHQHIFIDPNPDPEKSYVERERLFNLPRSSWADYDPKLISKGGGVFERSAKLIKLTPEIKKLLDIKKDTIIPNELISCMLKAKVDLLFNGGIGTYVKGESETHNEVGDRANDTLRVNGSQLRCKVVGEGGNLGLTQLGRVEFALNGGISYTDFIDNSAGVDCSDHEVNLKILLNSIVAAGDMTEKQRNKLLEELTDDIARLVLSNNYRQTCAVSLAASRSNVIVEEYIRFIEELEKMGRLDRDLEFLPSNEELLERKVTNKGLTRPELSIVLAYSKNMLKEALLETDVDDDPYFSKILALAFPEKISKKYPIPMQEHRLKKQIIATQLASMMTDDMGATFVRRLYDETGATPKEVAVSFMVVREIFDIDSLWEGIDSLDNQVDAVLQMRMMARVMRLLRRSTRWFLRNRRDQYDIGECIAHYAPQIKKLYKILPSTLQGQELERFEKKMKEYIADGVPEKLAQRVALSTPMVSALDMIEASTHHKLAIEEVAKMYFEVGNVLQLSWFREELANHPVGTNWDSLARAMCRDDLDRQQRAITEGILKMGVKEKSMENCVNAWTEAQAPLIERWQYMLNDLKSTPKRSFTMFSVALRELLDLAQSSHAQCE